MSGPYAAVAKSDVVERRLERIGVHLDKLAHGHDPLGHLLAIERLARSVRSEWAPLTGRSAGRG